MGCLKFIIKVAIVVLAIVGFKSLGGWDWCVKTFHIGQKPTQQSMLEKTKDVADFSKIPDAVSYTHLTLPTNSRV